MMVAHHESFNQQEWNREQIKSVLATMVTLIAWGAFLACPAYLPTGYVGMVLSFVPAIYMTGFLCLYPNSLRSRRGSLSAAICLVTCLWLIAMGVIAATL